MSRPRQVPARPLVLVTGATDGIGRVAATTLAARGARLVLHGRSAERLERAAAELGRAHAGSVVATARADFAALAEVRALADDVERRVGALDALVNNAGLYTGEPRRSADGFELTFAVNHLAPFLLTHLVWAGPSRATLARVVNVASNAHRSGHLDGDDLALARRPFSSLDAYATSKLGNVLFTVELARRLQPLGVVANSMHPGVITTKLLKAGFGMAGFDPIDDAADTITRLALDPAAAIGSGRYYSGGRPAQPSAAARDAALARAFYAESVRLVGVAPLPEPA